MEFDAYKDRRSQYRNHARSAIELSAELIVGPGRSYPAEVINTSANGVRLSFQGRRVPRLPLGTLVEVRFQQAGVTKSLVALGQAGNQTQDEGPLSLGVRFTRKDEFYDQLTPELWEQFNRRRRIRVRFLGDKAPSAKIESGGETWRGKVFDISEQGLGIDVDALTAEDLESYELVRVRTKLPGKLGVIDVAGLRVHDTEFGRAHRIGLLFDPPHTPDFGGQQERIERFVRQVHLSQRGA